MIKNNTYATSHAEPSTYSTAVLSGLGIDQHHVFSATTRPGGRGRVYLMPQTRHVYGGTVPYETIQKRRAKNRAARKSRRINRLRAWEIEGTGSIAQGRRAPSAYGRLRVQIPLGPLESVTTEGKARHDRRQPAPEAGRRVQPRRC